MNDVANVVVFIACLIVGWYLMEILRNFARWMKKKADE